MAKFPKKLKHRLAQRQQQNAFRTLSTKNGLADFSSNDYLGLSNEKSIAERAIKLLRNDKNEQNGATGSRLLSGNYELYNRLENHLCEWYGTESSLVFNSGYDANLGFFSTVPQRGDFIFYDERCHASIRDGIRLGQAKSHKFKHNDLKDLQSVTERSRSDSDSETYVVTESVFSMDGDSPDLLKFSDWAVNNNVHLIVDEAHAIGTFGKGLIHHLDLKDVVFARIITFGKALGAHGAAVLGSQDLKDLLVNFCRSFIYTTGLPPHTVATILAGYAFLDSDAGKKHLARLQRNIDYFKSKIVQQQISANFMASNSAIQVCRVGGNEKTKKLSAILEKNGFDVKPILSPTVPQGQERLRFCLHAFNSKDEIERVLQVVKKNLHEE